MSTAPRSIPPVTREVCAYCDGYRSSLDTRFCWWLIGLRAGHGRWRTWFLRRAVNGGICIACDGRGVAR